MLQPVKVEEHREATQWHRDTGNQTTWLDTQNPMMPPSSCFSNALDLLAQMLSLSSKLHRESSY